MNYTFDITTTDYCKVNEMQDWCSDNLQHRFWYDHSNYKVKLSFEDERDFIWFKLRWQ